MERHDLLLSIMLGILCSFIFIHSYAQGSASNTPEGYWKVFDRVTGQPKSIVKIWKTPNQELMGKIIKVFAKAGGVQRCIACTGSQYKQPVIGMTILAGLKPKQRQWSHGKLLNLENGKTYNCALRTLDNGNKLSVRNYIGLPYFGHVETWERVDLLSG